MKRIVFLCLLAVLTTGAALAHERENLLFTGDLSLFDVRGPVREISNMSRSALMSPEGDSELSVRFDRKGHLTSYRPSYEKEFIPLEIKGDDFNKRDKNGNLSACYDLFDLGFAGALYDTDGELVRYFCGVGNIDINAMVTFIYNVNGDLVKTVSAIHAYTFKENGDGEWEDYIETVDYTITKRDSYSNWIERKWSNKGSTGWQQRTITYY